jgi:hypothetical protein
LTEHQAGYTMVPSRILKWLKTFAMSWN